LPWRGPLVKPQTNGAVLRYCTMEMRSLGKFVVLLRKPKYTGSCRAKGGDTETLKDLQGLERLDHLEKRQLSGAQFN
jgi:hypothetical protein